MEARDWIENCPNVTSEMVLTEFLDWFADKGQYFRVAASQIVDEIINDKNTEVVPQSSEMFEDAFSFYKDRPDKGWQLTDCASILIMQKFGIQEVLTGDHHFEQAGFTSLLRG